MRNFALLLIASISFVACTGPVGTNGPVGEINLGEEQNGNNAEDYPAYETFDPSGYNAEPLPQWQQVVHDVPDRLMEGRIDVPEEDTPTVRTVEGFRIQVFSSDDRNAADATLAEASAWWETQHGRSGVPENLEPSIAYIQPYYRVRLGAFETREGAEQILEIVREQYRDAFVVPDLVTIRE